MLRATREDPAAAAAAGISVYRQRLLAFTLSGALAGFAGGLYVHFQTLQAGGRTIWVGHDLKQKVRNEVVQDGREYERNRALRDCKRASKKWSRSCE